MILALVMTLCLNGTCKEVKEYLPPEVSLMTCMVQGQMYAAQYIERNAPQWNLSKYRCLIINSSEKEA